MSPPKWARGSISTAFARPGTAICTAISVQMQLQCNYIGNSAANVLALQLKLHWQSISTELGLAILAAPTTLS